MTAADATRRYGRRGGGWAEGPKVDHLRELDDLRVRSAAAGDWPEGRGGADGWGMAYWREVAAEADRMEARGLPLGRQHHHARRVVEAEDRAGTGRRRRRSKPAATPALDATA